MNLVDEEHVALLEVGEECREVAGLRDHRPRRGAEIHAEFARHDLRQGRLAQTGRADEEHVIERLVARPRRFDEYCEVLARLLLADKLGKPLRAQRRLGRVFLAALGGDELVSGAFAHRSDPRRYLLGKSSPIGTAVGVLPSGTITRAFGS